MRFSTFNLLPATRPKIFLNFVSYSLQYYRLFGYQAQSGLAENHESARQCCGSGRFLTGSGSDF
jgi:hypothetical protein